MIYYLKQTINLITWQASHLFLFELLHKLFAFIFIFPIISFATDWIMKQIHLSHLSVENITTFLTFPLTLPICLTLALLVGFYLFFEITTIIIYFQSAVNQQTQTFMDLIHRSFKRSLYILNPKNILLLILVIFLIPFTNTILKLDLLIPLKIPDFILEFISKNAVLGWIYFLLIIGLELIVCRWIFSLHEITLNTNHFREARKRSQQLTKGKKIKIIISILIWGMLINLFFILFYLISIPILTLFVKIFYNSTSHQTIFLDLTLQYKILLSVINPSLLVITNFSIVTLLYEKAQGHSPTIIRLKESHPTTKSLTSFFKWLAILFLLFINGTIISEDKLHLFMGRSKYYSQPIIIAHRASTIAAPENTLAAFDQAFLSDAQFAEIDVQQTRDGHLIIMHDENFKRTTGHDKNVWDVDYMEVQTYDAGSWYNIMFKEEKIPTLEQVLQYAKGKINLLIEVKSNPYSTGIIEQVIQLIEQYDYLQNSLIASMDYELLRQVKEINPVIKTVYISALAYGDLNDLDAVDVYAIERSFLTTSLIEQIHSQGKKIFAWTINKENAIKQVLSMDIDGIITDNPFLVDFYVNSLMDPYVNYFIQSYFTNSPNPS